MHLRILSLLLPLALAFGCAACSGKVLSHDDDINDAGADVHDAKADKQGPDGAAVRDQNRGRDKAWDPTGKVVRDGARNGSMPARDGDESPKDTRADATRTRRDPADENRG